MGQFDLYKLEITESSGVMGEGMAFFTQLDSCKRRSKKFSNNYCGGRYVTEHYLQGEHPCHALPVVGRACSNMHFCTA